MMTNKQFIMLYNEHYNALLQYSLNICTDRPRALDVLQDAALRAYRNKTQLNLEGNFKTRMFAIIQNTYISKHQKNERAARLSGSTASHNLPQYLVSSERGEGQQLSWKQILANLNHLPDKYRKPFLFHFWGYTISEISERMNVPINSIKTRIQIAREIIQSLNGGALVA